MVLGYAVVIDDGGTSPNFGRPVFLCTFESTTVVLQ